ncbi:MAG: DUF1801 domain-containing protein [Crocinitomicaceae bacterium]|nr:DUF1801 domain-containing protein [Crocinitomicaceae bacterium]
MAGLATQETDKSVDKYIESVDNASKQADAKILVDLMEKVTGHPAKIWGDNFIIGFGKYKYKRKQGKEEYEWFNVGFAPRKTKITVYLTMDISQQEDLLPKLGKVKYGKGCLYINKLADVDLSILEKLIQRSAEAEWGIRDFD